MDFLYVQYPYRVDEESTQVPWGADAYENDNADQVLKLLGKNSVDVLDLRDALQDGKTIQVFMRQMDTGQPVQGFSLPESLQIT